jgi:signal peptidase I
MFDLIKRIGTFFLDTIETVVVALAIFVVIYLFLVQPHQVKGSSMLPNFIDGEYILTDKISNRFKNYELGDVIVFKAPKDHEIDFIKRIIGLPGDVVKISAGKVYVNNTLLREKYLPVDFTTNPGMFLRNDSDIIVPPNEYVVLGDNRNHSSDSREWGFVKKEEIIGKAWFRYWPVSQVGFVPKIDYK